MRFRRDQAGFTLIELVVAMSIFVVLLLAAGVAYGNVVKLYTKDQLTQAIQRDGDSVLAHMSRNLREATAYDAPNSNLVTDPNTLQVRLLSGQTRKYYVASGQLHYVDEAGSDQSLLPPGTTVTSLTFTPAVDTDQALRSVKISATLRRARGTYATTLNIGSTITTRPQ
jgi:prepilin-type N-terminal cleavage/methylation domain-containing protein